MYTGLRPLQACRSPQKTCRIFLVPYRWEDLRIRRTQRIIACSWRAMKRNSSLVLVWKLMVEKAFEKQPSEKRGSLRGPPKLEWKIADYENGTGHRSLDRKLQNHFLPDSLSCDIRRSKCSNQERKGLSNVPYNRRNEVVPSLDRLLSSSTKKANIVSRIAYQSLP